jgi:predicted dienelactone hydrolase
VTLTTGPLVDYSRNDSASGTPSARKLMLSVFEPASCTKTVAVPYMPNKTAEYQSSYVEQAFNVSGDFSSLFLEARLPVCPKHPTSCSASDDDPILLLFPGWGTPRLYYSVLASAIASQGFMVITVDSPGVANIITYPDGHAAYLTNSTFTPEVALEAGSLYATDASFVLDQLTNATAMAKLLPHRTFQSLQTNRIGMLGHSLGGAAAIVAASQDPRIRAAINWDGSLFTELPASGLKQPVLLLMDAVTDVPPDWEAAWPLFKGPKLWVEVANTTHESFSDVTSLLKAAGQDESQLAELLGTIAPVDLVRLLSKSTAAWMHAAFAAEGGKPFKLENGLGKFPEISTLKKGGF